MENTVNNPAEAHGRRLNAGRKSIETHWAHPDRQATLRRARHEVDYITAGIVEACRLEVPQVAGMMAENGTS